MKIHMQPPDEMNNSSTVKENFADYFIFLKYQCCGWLQTVGKIVR